MLHTFLPPMLIVAAMFVAFGLLRPGEDCGGHCRTCSGSGCATRGSLPHE